MIERLIGEDVQFAFSHAEPPQLVLIDPGQFEQIVMNLAINARDAMPGGGQLTLLLDRVQVDSVQAAELEIAAGAYVMLAVSDTGEGIDAETLEHIFEPFFTTKAPGSGTGLGLSTVFGIVHQSGGAIEVSSVVKQGSTFRVFFPLSGAPAADREPEPSSISTRERTSTILLAEDEQGVRAFLEMALTRAGHRVIATTSGIEAIAIAGAQHRAHRSTDRRCRDAGPVGSRDRRPGQAKASVGCGRCSCRATPATPHCRIASPLIPVRSCRSRSPLKLCCRKFESDCRVPSVRV